MRKYLIAPSILSANLAKLGEEVKNVLSAGADVIHFDVMDNHYVPNLTFGPLLCQALRDDGIKAPIDVHLMTKPVDQLIHDFAKAGASWITFHPEASEHIDRSLQLIKDLGCQAGLAFNPATPLNWLEYTLPKLDLILLMTVNPGFGGQPFIPEMLDKIDEARELIDANNLPIKLAVDGGVNAENIGDLRTVGTDVFIAGSAIFKSKDYKKTIQLMRDELRKVTG